jgi:peptidoglycan/xylan/chitin deacetylase (PgdA/CDA1 family)
MVMHGDRSRHQVALTIDDGPGRHTAKMLDILAREQVPATFYVLGGSLSGFRSALARREHRLGNEVANHSFGHELLPSASSIARTRSRIRTVTGFKTCTFRPPYGAVNSDLVGRAGALGMATIIWDIDTNDWRLPGVGSIVSTVLRNGKNGSIVLMHDGSGYRPQTVAALPAIIHGLKLRGYEFVTVDELLGLMPR